MITGLKFGFTRLMATSAPRMASRTESRSDASSFLTEIRLSPIFSFTASAPATSRSARTMDSTSRMREMMVAHGPPWAPQPTMAILFMHRLLWEGRFRPVCRPREAVCFGPRRAIPFIPSRKAKSMPNTEPFRIQVLVYFYMLLQYIVLCFDSCGGALSLTSVSAAQKHTI